MRQIIYLISKGHIMTKKTLLLLFVFVSTCILNAQDVNEKPTAFVKEFIKACIANDAEKIKSMCYSDPNLSVLWSGAKLDDKQLLLEKTAIDKAEFQWFEVGDQLQLPVGKVTVNKHMVSTRRKICLVKYKPFPTPVQVVFVGKGWKVKPMWPIIAVKQLQEKQERDNQANYKVKIGNKWFDVHLDKISYIEVDGKKVPVYFSKNETQLLSRNTFSLFHSRQLKSKTYKKKKSTQILLLSGQQTRFFIEVYDEVGDARAVNAKAVATYKENYTIQNAAFSDRGVVPAKALTIAGKVRQGKEMDALLGEVHHKDFFYTFNEGKRMVHIHGHTTVQDLAIYEEYLAKIIESLKLK